MFRPTALPTSICSVGTLYISPEVKWPKYTADHCCLLPKLRDGGAMFPFSHIPIWCTEGRYYFNGKKFVLQKWGKIIIIIILSNNGLSCHMIMFHVLNNLQFLLSLYDFTLKSWMRIEILKSVYNMGLVVYFSFIYLIVWMRSIYCCVCQCYMYKLCWNFGGWI